MVNNDWAFDDPAGNFPAPLADLTAASLQTFSSHLASIQGVLGLASGDIDAIFADAGAAADMVNVGGTNVPAFTLNNLSVCYRYAVLADCLGLDVEDMIDLKQMSGLNPFQPASGVAIANLSQDVLFNTTVQYVTWAQRVQASGFAVEDLQYLLRHQFDPVGKYQVDINAQLTLLQQTAAGLAQIQTQNALPPNLSSMPETLLDQTLSGLIPSAILKSLFAILTNAQGYSAIASAPAAIDPTPFAAETGLSFSYDTTTQIQTVTYTGLLLDWKKAELLTINTSAEFSGLLDGVQQAANTALAQSIGNILGVWASLVEYEAVETGATEALPATELLGADPALSLSYDAIGQLQWAGYRGVLTDANKNALAAVAMPSAALANLLSQILTGLQSQSLPVYANLAGALLGMLTNVQTFEAATSPVTAATAATDASSFAAALQTAQQNGAITGPVPAIQFSYDETSQTETISVQGVLTQSLATQISGLAGVSANAQSLLASARASMVALFQSLAAGLLTVAATDLDNYAAPFLGLNAAQSQRQAKADLIQVFLPLQAENLSLSFILQTLTSALSSDPSLTEALVTDTALLSDPSNPGKALEGSFLGLSQPGVSASYFGAGGALLASGIESTADTTNAPSAAAGFTSCAYTGYLQVPTDGPYRFFAELADIGATVNLALTAPPNSPLIANPVIPIAAGAGSGTATTANSEISQFVTLQAGVFYQFTLTFTSVGPNGARLLVQSENMPKGPLNQIVLCPQTLANNFITAYTLLAKALQVIETANLDLREIGYLIANAPSFANLRLSSLPTQPGDANMTALFQQMLMLIDYADLRKNPAGGTDGLIDVFEGAGVTFTEAPGSQASNTNPATPWAALANLFRRDVSDVRAIATYFGFIQDQVIGANENVTAIGAFANNQGIRRIWQALQLVQILGIPVQALTASTAIASLNPPATPAASVIATNFQNAVKAQYTTQQWLPIAQSVFDPLRQAKRDALVAYIVQEKGFENQNQLFEYFLVDPGMQPVVQTSRLRLGMSSLQTFVQRCLLNLESSNPNAALNLSPSAIDADWWSWMKRYRVWQANREIFLYPENWMVPELRLGSSDLFQTLQGALLQGDVTDDLANQAFLDYLTGLEQRARLDVVSTYLDQDLTDAGVSTLHVLARTYGHPHKYFHRTYASSVWSAWTAVTQDFDGDHIAIAIWKGRLNVFWLTFITQAQAPASADTSDTATLSQMQFNALSGDISSSGNPTKLAQVQLHWCEYYQGKWSKPIASDVNNYNPIPVVDSFTPGEVHIRITKETTGDGGEGAIRVVLDFPAGVTLDLGYVLAMRTFSLGAGGASRRGIVYKGPRPVPTYSFRVTSKNCDLVLNTDFYNYPPFNPYNTSGVDASIFTGSSSLTSTFESTLNSDGSGSNSTEQILESVDNYGLLLPSAPISPSPFITSGPNLAQAGSLLSPFFYKDRPDTNNTDEMTFYVQPDLTVSTIDNWTYWAVLEPPASSILTSGVYLNGLALASQTPTAGPAPALPVDENASLYGVQSSPDWLTSAATTVLYQNAVVGQTGGLNLDTVPAAATNVATRAGRAPQRQKIVFGPRGLANQVGKPKAPAAGKVEEETNGDSQHQLP